MSRRCDHEHLVTLQFDVGDAGRRQRFADDGQIDVALEQGVEQVRNALEGEFDVGMTGTKRRHDLGNPIVAMHLVDGDAQLSAALASASLHALLECVRRCQQGIAMLEQLGAGGCRDHGFGRAAEQQ